MRTGTYLLIGAAQQLWLGLSRQRSVAGLCGEDVFAYICVVALIPHPRWYVNTDSLWSVLSITDKIWTPPARCSGVHDSVIGTMRPVCSKSGHLVLPQVTSNKKSFLKG